MGLSVPFFLLLFTATSEEALLLGWLLFIAALVAVLITVSLRYALSPYLVASQGTLPEMPPL